MDRFFPVYGGRVGFVAHVFFLGFGIDPFPSGYSVVRERFFFVVFSGRGCYGQSSVKCLDSFLVDCFRADLVFYPYSFRAFRSGLDLAALRIMRGYCRQREERYPDLDIPVGGFGHDIGDTDADTDVRYGNDVGGHRLLRAILKSRNKGIILYSVLLAMLRTRGVILCFSLAMFCFFQRYGMPAVRLIGENSEETAGKRWMAVLKNTFALFLPALGMAVVLCLLQWILQRGVFGFGPDSPWKIASLSRIFRNILAFPRFILDLGKVFLWMAVFFLLFRFGMKKFWKAIPQDLVRAYACVASVLLAVTVPFENPMSARYYLFLFVLFALMTGMLLFSLLPFKTGRRISAVMIVLLWGAHFMRYPEGIAVSWDSTLSHLPYYGLRQEVESCLREKGADPGQVKALFPYEKPLDLVYLNGKELGRLAYREFSSSDTAAYIVYSNIANVEDRESAGIDTQHYVLDARFSRSAVYFEIWRRKEMPVQSK